MTIPINTDLIIWYWISIVFGFAGGAFYGYLIMTFKKNKGGKVNGNSKSNCISIR